MANSNTPQTAKYFFIASKLKTKDKNFLVFDIQSANPNPGAPIDAYQLKSTGNENQMWQWGPGDSKDGRLLISKMNGFAVDILNAGTDAGTPLDAFPVKTSDTANQLWTLTRDGHLVSQLNSLVIEIPSDADLSAAPVLAMNTQGSGLNQQWSIIPDYPLEDILRMKGDGFQSFTGGQETAFEAINKQLGVKNIRAEYVNTNKAISKALLEGLQRPSTVQPDDWNKVLDQLGLEFQAVADVRALFDNFLTFYTELTVDQQARLNQAAVDADMDTGTVVTYSWIGLIESLVIAFLSLITIEVGLGLTLGVVAAAAASIVSGIVNVVLSKQQISDTNLTFQGALSGLWSQLSANFETILIGISQQQNDILENWNKLQAVEARINAAGPTALKWNVEANSQLVKTGGIAYTIFTLQQLLPTRFQIRRWSQIGSPIIPKGFPTNPPASATWTEVIDDNQGFANLYTIQDSQGLFPGTQALMEDLWNNGVQQADFFNARNGWEQFQIVEQALESNSVAINFVNQSSNILTIVGIADSTAMTELRGASARILSPYENLISVFDATVILSKLQFPAYMNYQITGIMSFRAIMNQSGIVSIDQVEVADGYAFETSATVNANIINNTGASFTLTIWQQ